MLHLAERTDPGWVDRVLPGIDELLVEQAHLERKAASAALTFMFTYQQYAVIQEPLSGLAREELEHFELVLSHLRRRGLPLRRLRPSPYPARLKRVVRAAEPARCLDAMLVSAVIEARSCERMKLLGDALRPVDAALGEMYRTLVASEARHHSLYLDLCRRLFPGEDVDGRLAWIARHEAAVLAGVPEAPRLHGR